MNIGILFNISFILLCSVLLYALLLCFKFKSQMLIRILCRSVNAYICKLLIYTCATFLQIAFSFSFSSFNHTLNRSLKIFSFLMRIKCPKRCLNPDSFWFRKWFNGSQPVVSIIIIIPDVNETFFHSFLSFPRWKELEILDSINIEHTWGAILLFCIAIIKMLYAFLD